MLIQSVALAYVMSLARAFPTAEPAAKVAGRERRQNYDYLPALPSPGSINALPDKRITESYTYDTDFLNDVAKAVEVTKLLAINNLDTETLQPVSRVQEERLDKEGAYSEREDAQSKVFTTWDTAQKKGSSFFKPTPLVDRIQEYEKFGNYGDKQKRFNDIVIGTFEAMFNFLNKAVEAPKEPLIKLSDAAVDRLNHIGAKIVGLA